MIKKSKKWEKFKKSKKQRASGNPKEHWKVLNSKKEKWQIPITVNEFYDNFKQLVSDDNIEDDVDNVIDLDGFNNEPSPMLNDQITKKDVRRNINK